MITLTIILIGKFIYGLLNNKPAVRFGSNDILTGLLGFRELARVARQSLFKVI